jgi:hypothetical protein
MIALHPEITKWRSHRLKCDAVHTITDKALCAKYVIIALATDLPTKLMERGPAPFAADKHFYATTHTLELSGLVMEKQE